MKNFIPFIIIFILFVCDLKALNKKVAGQIILEDKIEKVTFLIPIFSREKINFEKLQYKVVYFNNSGKKIKLNPRDAKEVLFMYKGQRIRLVSSPKPPGTISKLFTTYVFLRIIIDDDLKLYFFYEKSNYNSGTKLSGGIRHILQKNNKEYQHSGDTSNKKFLLKYFDDCPELTTKIKTKELSYNDIHEIVRFYNSNCL